MRIFPVTANIKNLLANKTHALVFLAHRKLCNDMDPSAYAAAASETSCEEIAVLGREDVKQIIPFSMR
jgi:hypothetical protein